MGPSPSPPSEISDGWRRRRERQLRHIQRSALELFATRGADVTVEQIAKAAGISTRTFFRYFPSRDDVLLHMPRAQVDRLCALVAARPASETILEAFIAAVHEGQDDIDEEITLLWGRAIQSGAIPVRIDLTSSRMAISFRQVIAARLLLREDDLRAEVLATAISGVIWAAYLRWFADARRTTLVTVVEESFNILRQLDSTADRSRPPDYPRRDRGSEDSR